MKKLLALLCMSFFVSGAAFANDHEGHDHMDADTGMEAEATMDDMETEATADVDAEVSADDAEAAMEEAEDATANVDAASEAEMEADADVAAE